MEIVLAAASEIVHDMIVAIPIREFVWRDSKLRRCNVVVVMYCCCLQSAVDFVAVAGETAMPLVVLGISYDGNRVGLMLLPPMLLLLLVLFCCCHLIRFVS